MAEPVMQVCPVCRFDHNRVHSLAMYEIMPRIPMSDDCACALLVGLCVHTGLFIYWTTAGWYVIQVTSRPNEAEFYGMGDGSYDE